MTSLILPLLMSFHQITLVSQSLLVPPFFFFGDLSFLLETVQPTIKRVVCVSSNDKHKPSHRHEGKFNKPWHDVARSTVHLAI